MSNTVKIRTMALDDFRDDKKSPNQKDLEMNNPPDDSNSWSEYEPSTPDWPDLMVNVECELGETGPEIDEDFFNDDIILLLGANIDGDHRVISDTYNDLDEMV